MASHEDFITIEHISKSFSGLRALQDVSFSIRKGEALGLCGANGSGKSTLIKILAGVLQADEGTIRIEGKAMTAYGPLSGIRHGISVIYQDISLFPTLPVLENICLARSIEQGRKISWLRGERRRAQSILDDLGVRIDIDAPVEELPIASQQLVAIARALNNKSRLIILDEPTTALTAREVRELFKIINKLKAGGISVIFISHKMDEVMELCDGVTVLRDGKLIASKPIGETSRGEIETLMVGQETEYARMAPVAEGADLILEVEGLSKRNNFKDIAFSLRRGEVLGIIGLLGSGRTELALALFGVSPVDTGAIRIEGQPVTIRTVEDAVKAGVAYVPEDRLTEGLVMNYPIKDNVVLVTLDEDKTPRGFLDNSRIRQLAERWIGKLSIKTDSPDHLVSSLSGGNQQKVIIARCLELGSDVIILDEPTRGIDVSAKYEIYTIILGLAKQGKCIIMISSEMPELLGISDRIMVMCEGRVTGILDGKTATQEEIMRLAAQFM